MQTETSQKHDDKQIEQYLHERKIIKNALMIVLEDANATSADKIDALRMLKEYDL